MYIVSVHTFTAILPTEDVQCYLSGIVSVHTFKAILLPVDVQCYIREITTKSVLVYAP